jgi:hypothetical protein
MGFGQSIGPLDRLQDDRPTSQGYYGVDGSLSSELLGKY